MTMPAVAPPSRPLGGPPPPPPPPPRVVLVLLLLCPPVVFVALGSWEGEKVAALDTVGLDKGDHCGEVEGDRVSTDTADEGVEVEVKASVMT